MSEVPRARFLELAPVLVSAFAIPRGIFLLRDLISQAVQYDIFNACNETWALGDSVRAVLEQLDRSGDGTKTAVVQALFTTEPGNVELRAWVSAYAPDLLALVSDSDFAAARGDYQKARMEGQSTLAKAGLNQLPVLRQLASVRQEVAQRHDVIALAAQQLNVVRFYKTLHDKLHLIQVLAFAELGKMQLKRELDDLDRATILAHVKMMRAGLPGIKQDISTLKSVQAPVNDAWLGRYDDALVRLTGATPVDKQALRSFSTELRSVLSNQLSAINRSLVTAAATIDFRRVSSLLTVIAASLSVDSASEVNKQAALALVRAADAIDALGADLQSTISAHTIWQQIDTQLWGFGLGLVGATTDEGAHADMLDIWALEFVDRLRGLERLDPGAWSDPRRQAEAAMGAALAAEPPALAEMRRCFEAFASEARDCFYDVDTLLLSRSTGVVELLPDLQAISRSDGGDGN